MDRGGTAPFARQQRDTPESAKVRWQAWGIVACLAGSAFALALAPLLMPASYSWISHTTSESAAQGVSGAWVARLGFLMFGLAVLWLAGLAGSRWGRWGTLAHRTFGVLMTATAAFSHRPFEPGVFFDRTEDLLHSVTATAMGFAFVIGVVAAMVHRPGRLPARRALDAAALVASVVIPLSMEAASGSAGVLQRSMFLVAYLWYATEALDTTGRRSATQA